MSKAVKKVVIVGGGTAGWLSAAIISAHHKNDDNNAFQVTLIESSDIPTVGVGEGTWPTMKKTLRDIGLKESDVFKHCHAAFKQGGKFVNWVHPSDDAYYHPFTLPLGYGRLDLAPYVENIEDFAGASNFQQEVCEAGLAPRTLAEQEYNAQCNYGYHVDAGALADMLKKHCISNLAVRHIVATVEDVLLDSAGDIACVQLADHEKITGDLFIDCTGFACLLLGKKLGVPFISKDDVLFNDSALALHVPYENEKSPLATHTIATGQNAGWIWDIGLTHRRGVGHVYSSTYLSDEQAEQNLRAYLGGAAKDVEPRKISFKSGHRQQFWKRNCVAVGMAGGFVEPLEATAIMLIEVASRFIAENIPAVENVMPLVEKRFNEQMHYRWQRIIDFLKLHYMLTKRPEPYWQAHCVESSIPESLKEDLAIWATRGPLSSDFTSTLELFPAASYQYVLYGMGFKPDFTKQSYLYRQKEDAEKIINRNKQLTQQMLNTLVPHRDFINTWLRTTG